MLLILGAGAFFDVKEHRIPNWWIFLGIITGILPGFFEMEPLEGIGFLLRFVFVTAVFFIFFICRMIGAGDIKLAALICGYLGVQAGALAIGLGFLIGAFFSLIKMTAKGTLIKRLSCLLTYIRCVLHTGKLTVYYDPVRDGYDAVIPLGMCLFLGTMVSFLL